MAEIGFSIDRLPDLVDALPAIGDPAVFVSVDAMHQGPQGGGPVIAIVDVGE